MRNTDPGFVVLTIPEALGVNAKWSPDCGWLLEHGRFWEPGPWPSEADEAIEAGNLRFEKARCFANARKLHLAHESQSFTYVEGVAMLMPEILEWHGWLVTEDETVVDPTWHLGESPPYDRQYFGADIPRSQVEGFTGDTCEGIIPSIVGKRSGGRISLRVPSPTMMKQLGDEMRRRLGI